MEEVVTSCCCNEKEEGVNRDHHAHKQTKRYTTSITSMIIVFQQGTREN